jgi:hypothetical protein
MALNHDDCSIIANAETPEWDDGYDGPDSLAESMGER